MHRSGGPLCAPCKCLAVCSILSTAMARITLRCARISSSALEVLIVVFLIPVETFWYIASSANGLPAGNQRIPDLMATPPSTAQQRGRFSIFLSFDREVANLTSVQLIHSSCRCYSYDGTIDISIRIQPLWLCSSLRRLRCGEARASTPSRLGSALGSRRASEISD